MGEGFGGCRRRVKGLAPEVDGQLSMGPWAAVDRLGLGEGGPTLWPPP